MNHLIAILGGGAALLIFSLVLYFLACRVGKFLSRIPVPLDGSGKPLTAPEYTPEIPFPGPVTPIKVHVYVGEMETDYSKQIKLHRERARVKEWN